MTDYQITNAKGKTIGRITANDENNDGILQKNEVKSPQFDIQSSAPEETNTIAFVKVENGLVPLSIFQGGGWIVDPSKAAAVRLAGKPPREVAGADDANGNNQEDVVTVYVDGDGGVTRTQRIKYNHNGKNMVAERNKAIMSSGLSNIIKSKKPDDTIIIDGERVQVREITGGTTPAPGDGTPPSTPTPTPISPAVPPGQKRTFKPDEDSSDNPAKKITATSGGKSATTEDIGAIGELDPSEAQAIMDKLGIDRNTPGNTEVKVTFGESGDPLEKVMTVDDIRRAATIGRAKLKYRKTPNGRVQTQDIEYNLQEGTDKKIGNEEAKEIRAAVEEQRADAEKRGEKWHDVRVEAEGEDLEFGLLRDRTRTGKADDPENPDDEARIARSMSTRDVESKLKQSIEDQKYKLDRLRVKMQQIIDSIQFRGFDIQEFIRILRFISRIMSIQGQIVKAVAIKDMVKKQEKLDEIREDLEALDGEAKGYTAKLRAKMSEQQGLQDDIQATMSVVRQAESFIDELRGYLKSVQDSTHGRQTGMASFRD